MPDGNESRSILKEVFAGVRYLLGEYNPSGTLYITSIIYIVIGRTFV